MPKLRQALGWYETPNKKVNLQKFVGITSRRDKNKPRSKPHKTGTIYHGWVLGDKTTKIQQNAQARKPCKDQNDTLSQVRKKP